MTFSILGRCEDTNMFGVAISSSSICVASRCPWVRSNVGAASTQNITDPSLGNLMLNYLEEGLSADEAIDKIVNGLINDFIKYVDDTIPDSDDMDKVYKKELSKNLIPIKMFQSIQSPSDNSLSIENNYSIFQLFASLFR